MLHILNGDSTADSFYKANIPADEVIVWRELLSEGPVISTDQPADFWLARQGYISQTYNEDAQTYADKVTTEVKRLEIYPRQDEVVLWFEHDLLCQVNLLFLLNWFARHDLGRTKLSLVCIGSHPEKPGFKGLGELSPAQLAALFPQRRQLTTQDLAFGSQGWQAYTAPSPEALTDFLKEDFSRLPLLKPALEAHLTRFPSVQNGLNAIEQLLLQLIADSNPATLVLFEKFWQQDNLFGLGDSQIVNYLKELEQAGLIEIIGPIMLTPLGLKVWQAQADYVQLKPLDRWLGGVHLQPGQRYWRWDTVRQQLVKE